MARPNTTQRSWSNYVGNRPIESRRGTDFYRDSPLYGAGGSMSENTDAMRKLIRSRREKEAEPDTAPSVVPEESALEKLQRESALRRGMRSMQNAKPITAPVAYGGGMMA